MKLLTALLIVLGCFALHAQEITITGKITDPDNKPIAGATVTEQNGTASTTTAADGTFSLAVSESYGTLIVSHPDYRTQKIIMSGQTNLTVRLLASSGEEEVTSGFGSLSRDINTSSTSQISSESLGTQPVVDLEQATQGRAAGVLVQNSGGKLGQGTKVRIRGGSSLSGSNAPLYVVDGVPLTSDNQSDIDPSSIESMEVLKDAAATAMYGSRAANGVVLITTKKGESGKLKVDVEYQMGVSQTPKKLDMMSPLEYNQLFIEYTLRQPISQALIPAGVVTKENLEIWAREAYNLSQTHPDSTYQIQFGNGNGLSIPLLTRLTNNTDWQSLAFRNALSHRGNVNLSGGSAKQQYYVNMNYLTQDGILIGNDYERFGGRFNLNSTWSSKLTTSLSVGYAKTNNNRVNEDGNDGNPVQMTLLPPSDAPVPSNNYILDIRSAEYNPQTEVYGSHNFETTDRLNANLSAVYGLSDGLSLNVDGGVDYLDLRDERRQGPATQEGSPTGLSRLGTTKVFNYIANGFLSYDKSIGSSDLNVIAGASYQQSQGVITFRLARINSITQLEDLNDDNPSLLNNPVPGSAFSFLSYYARANYAINGKYVFQVSNRVDGSSKFGEDNRYGMFPAVSAGWNISNESFLSDNAVVSFLKLKASFGLVGNTPGDDFLYRANYFTINYGNQDGIRRANLANSALKWETTQQIDAGVDFGFLEDRISGSVGYYQKNTTDLLFPVPVSQTSGFTNVIQNTGEMTNSGIELAISSVNVESGDFSWTTDFNVATNENKVTNLGGGELISGVSAFIEGQPAGVFYLPEFLGVSSQTGRAQYDNGFGLPTDDYTAALRDARKVVGNPNPKYFGGMTNSIGYKGFNLNFTFQFVQGIDLYWETGELIANSGFGLYNQTKDQNDRWFQPGDEAANPVLNPLLENTNPSSRWIVDGSYIRLNNLSISYSLPETMVSNMGLRYLSVYIGGQNLITFSDYPGYDPDVAYSDPAGGALAENINRGIDFFTAPQPRIYTTGIKIGF